MADSLIVDVRGRRFSLPEPQTVADSNVAMVAERYQTHPASGITPDKAAQYLRAAEMGDLTAQADLAEDMEEKDTHLQSELGKRRRAVLAVDWMVEPPRNASSAEKRDSEMLQEILKDADWWEDMVFDSTDAILKSFSAQQMTWGYFEKLHIPSQIVWQDPGIFQQNPLNRHELMLQNGTYTGVRPEPLGWIIHRAKSKSGYISRTGLVRTLIWPFIFKNYSVRDLAEFLEIYGLPLRIGKYPSGASEKEKATLLRAVMQIGHNAGGIIPQGMQIDFQNAAQGQADPFEVMIDWAEKSMSKAILGGTLTTQSDGKSSTNALGEIHDEVRTEVRDSDLKQLAITINRDLIGPLYMLNCKSYRSPLRQPRIVFDTREPEDVGTWSDALPNLVGIGVDIPEAWVHDKLGIPTAQPGEKILSTSTSATREPPQLPAGARPETEPKAPDAALAANNQEELDELDDMEASVSGQQWADAMQPILQPVIDAMNSDGPQAAMQRAAELFPQMDDSALIKLLTGAIFAADIYGGVDDVSE
ncbi:DUF935 domain-containing protein [Salmonella enterica]|nr:DUF935 domain-containing protein [Salmonella enterica]